MSNTKYTQQVVCGNDGSDDDNYKAKIINLRGRGVGSGKQKGSDRNDANTVLMYKIF